jgi:hypothetical protein
MVKEQEGREFVKNRWLEKSTGQAELLSCVPYTTLQLLNISARYLLSIALSLSLLLLFVELIGFV